MEPFGTNSVEVVLIDASILPDVWNMAAPMIRKGVTYSEGRFSMNALFQELVDSKSQLWLIYNKDETEVIGALLTRILDGYKEKTCDVYLAGGRDVMDWLPEITRIEAWAKSLGCSELLISGRRGWVKVMKSYGYREHTVTISKILKEIH